ncbi:MAG: cofactor-independent phosphoglycerate mutase [Candidatus Poribacteria bacterium]|nr:cofactor-independent phosphoglycerate mutase [Candidatus Poribacteria bacterium]
MSATQTPSRPDTKFIVILSDGMAENPLDALGGKTPLEAAHTPNMDRVAAMGVVGQVNIIPDSQSPGSDVGNLSVLGYDPDRYLTGRAPLEAGAMGIELKSNQVAFRCNLVTLIGDEMHDYSAGHITSEEAAELIEAVGSRLGGDGRTFFPGVQYRHILVADEKYDVLKGTPPHDIMGQPFADHFPKGDGADEVIGWMKQSWDILKGHPVNRKRIASGKSPANSIWLWGQGKAPSLTTYPEKYGLKGSAISAVDLVRGIARYAGLDVLHVDGITGLLDTNYVGKAEVGLNSLEDGDFVYIHVEAPDEMGHAGDPQKKIQAIEHIDREIVSRVLDYMQRHPHTRVAILPDHKTLCTTRTHERGRVPFTACGVGIEADAIPVYTEKSAAVSEHDFPVGSKWMDWFLGVER